MSSRQQNEAAFYVPANISPPSGQVSYFKKIIYKRFIGPR